MPFAQLNKLTGLIEIIDEVSGKILRVQQNSDGIEADFTSHQLITGETVLLEKGLGPSDLLGIKHKIFSQVLVDLICQRIAEGGNLTKICKEPGMPSYNTVCSWRRSHPHIIEQLDMSRRDRAEFLRDAAVQEAVDATSSKDEVIASALRVETFKWAAGVDDVKYSPRAKVDVAMSIPTQIIVQTGIDRTPLAPPGEMRDASPASKIVIPQENASHETKDNLPTDPRSTARSETLDRQTTRDETNLERERSAAISSKIARGSGTPTE